MRANTLGGMGSSAHCLPATARLLLSTASQLAIVTGLLSEKGRSLIFPLGTEITIPWTTTRE